MEPMARAGCRSRSACGRLRRSSAPAPSTRALSSPGGVDRDLGHPVSRVCGRDELAQESGPGPNARDKAPRYARRRRSSGSMTRPAT